MKRSGFTMIELVFVIVILGILASVAIPKLAATRDDANIAKASTEISSIVSDMGSYYTAHGHFANIKDMTNVQLVKTKDKTYAEAKADDVNMTNNQTVYYADPSRGTSCVSFTTVDTNGTLTVDEEDATDTSLYCKGLKKAVSKLIAKHTFGGSSIY
jgi:prepilin-type N-terminal cleavage/methylation domain-containing protein